MQAVDETEQLDFHFWVQACAEATGLILLQMQNLMFSQQIPCNRVLLVPSSKWSTGDTGKLVPAL